MNLDILLTHGYFLFEDEAERRVMKPYPPLGILYISSYLKRHGFSVEVFDTTFRSKREFSERIFGSPPTAVGIYVNLMTKLNVLEMIRLCKAHGCVVIVGGPEVSNYAEEFLRFGADIAVTGEGEETLAELLPRIRTASPGLEEIPGITYKSPDGSIHHNPARPQIHNLDALPFPDREAINMQQYIDTWRDHHGRGSVSLICARGCPYTCTWCSRSVFGESHRRRSPRNVADEIEHIINTYHPDQLWFADDVFTINHRWFYDFYDEMKMRGLRIPFECITRADRLNEDILSKMADIGAFRIWYGSESGSQKILDAMQRNVTVRKIREVTAQARAVGIEAGLFVMLGYPGEQIDDIDATINHLKETNPDLYLTTIAYPIKGTTMYAELQHTLYNGTDWASTTDRMVEFAGRHTRRFYWFATRHLVNEVRLHKLRTTGGRRQFLPLIQSYTKSKVARLGMKLTSHEKT